MASRPPDISERVIIDLSGRIFSYYDPTTYKYDYAIGSTVNRQTVSDSTNLPNIQYAIRVQRDSGDSSTEAKASGIAKLLALGLTEDEANALVK